MPPRRVSCPIFCWWWSALVVGSLGAGAKTIRGSQRQLQSAVSISILSVETGEQVAQLLPDPWNTLNVIDFDGDTNLLNLVVDGGSDLGSVRFKLTNQATGSVIQKREGRSPFAFCGDANGQYRACGEGIIQSKTDYILEVLPQGVEEWQRYKFCLRPPPQLQLEIPSLNYPSSSPVVAPSSQGKLARFQLIDANSNEVIESDLTDGTVLQAKEGDLWNIEVIPLHEDIVYAKFSNEHGEGRLPYSLCGDQRGIFDACEDLHKTGDHSFSVVLIGTGGVKLARVSLDIQTVGIEALHQPPGSISGVPTGDWEILSNDAPITARHEACFVWVQGKAYLIGGRRMPTTDIYDPITESWTTTGALPPKPLHHMQCIVIKHEIWIVSAWTGSFPRDKTLDEMFIYDTVADAWSTKPAMPEERRRGSSAVVYDPQEDLIYVSHGNVGGHRTYNHDTPIATGWLDIYDVSTGVWRIGPDAPNPRDHTGGALLQNGEKLCVAGGRDSSRLGWPAVPETDCFDVATGIWTVEESIPVPRAGSSYGATCDGQFLLVAGGELQDSVFGQFSAFDGTQWTSLSNLRVARHGSSLAVDCTAGKIYIASGSGGPRARFELTSVEVFNY